MGRVRIFDPSHDPGQAWQLCSFFFGPVVLLSTHGAGIQPQPLNITTSRCDELVDEPEQWSEISWNMSNHVKSAWKLLSCRRNLHTMCYSVACEHATQPRLQSPISLGTLWQCKHQTPLGDPNWQWRSFMDDVPGENLGFSLPLMWAQEGALCCKVSFFHLLM